MLRTLIVDDEEPARRRLRQLLESDVVAGRIHLVGEAHDGPAAVDFLQLQDVDLVLLDIRMPEMDGFDVLERIALTRQPVIVFTTAFDDHALRAFEANAVDYLLKPITRQRLVEAIKRAERLVEAPEVGSKRVARLLDYVERQAAQPASVPPSRHYLERISVPYRDRTLILSANSIVSAQISGGITRVYADSDCVRRPGLRQHIVNYKLEYLEENLDPAQFMRVHRSALIRLDRIREMIPWFSGRYKLVLDFGHEVIASRERARYLKERLHL